MSSQGHLGMVERRRPQQLLSLRIVLWGALLTIHSLLLAMAFCLVQAGGAWSGTLAQAFGCFAFLGLLAPLANTASSLADLREALTANATGDSELSARSRWARFRPTVWAFLEMFSLAMLSFCGSIMVYVVASAI